LIEVLANFGQQNLMEGVTALGVPRRNAKRVTSEDDEKGKR
jgi:hypothetical protein